MRNIVRLIGAALLLAGAAALPASGQSPFSAAATVNERAVTWYEVDQRAALLQAFGQPGSDRETALQQLIEERVKQAEYARVGLGLSDEGLQAALAEFAGRAQLTVDEFTARLAGDGVAFETFRDYVIAGITWRDYIRSRYASRVDITEADIDRVLATRGDTTAGIEILVSEIIIPAPPERLAEAEAIAARITAMTSAAQFEAAAREYSALPSRDEGGRLDWLPLTQFPDALQPLFLSLDPGQVSQPITIPNGIALFQLRDIRETGRPAEAVARLDYAVLALPSLEDGARVAAMVDTCDDLYGVARGLPAEQLTREEAAPGAIPQDVALELAKLDAGEVSLGLTRDGGATRLLVMLCSRTLAANAEVDRAAIRDRLRNEQLTSYADGLLADLMASARIDRP
ncbi:peptidylprolyl isomerase [Wenxinia saemankumensis]|uniref:Parvulin-like PPIase n=1 Tax=Wenxinia saemankumensis TaxID=1447782 RepID=A0A1M6HHG7_9RHOB|nr:peptidylprolyl isomerase [Wenxinia saemankumensis]SHJ21615.1 periplasmic chaperone for outer membrane proteins SurA [Wenxinia saemankumensis]